MIRGQETQLDLKIKWMWWEFVSLKNISQCLHQMHNKQFSYTSNQLWHNSTSLFEYILFICTPQTNSKGSGCQDITKCCQISELCPPSSIPNRTNVSESGSDFFLFWDQRFSKWCRWKLKPSWKWWCVILMEHNAFFLDCLRIIYTVVHPYTQLIRYKTSCGDMKPWIIPNAIHNVIFV
jgi:hypothetical protein